MGGREAHDDSISEIHCGRCRDRLYYGGGQTDPYFATQPVSGAEGSGGDAVGRSPCLARKSRDLPVRSLLFSAYEASAGEQVRMLTRKAVNARRKRSAVLYVYGIDDILSVQKSVRRMDRDRLSKNTIPWASVAACELHPKSIGMLPPWHLSPLCRELVNAFLFWIRTDGQADCVLMRLLYRNVPAAGRRKSRARTGGAFSKAPEKTHAQSGMPEGRKLRGELVCLYEKGYFFLQKYVTIEAAKRDMIFAAHDERDPGLPIPTDPNGAADPAPSADVIWRAR